MLAPLWLNYWRLKLHTIDALCVRAKQTAMDRSRQSETDTEV